MTQRRPLDTGLRGLATRYSRDFLTWLQGTQAVFEQNLDPVLIAQERRADFLVRFRNYQGQPGILHAEFQRQVSESGPLGERLPFRMLEYALAIYRRYELVPQQVLVLLQPSAAADRLPDTFEAGTIRFQFRILRLWQIDPRPLLSSTQVGLLPLVPLMGGAPAEELLSTCVEAIDQQIESTQQRTELLTVALLLASIRVQPAFLTAFLESRAMFDLLQDTPLGQQLLQESELRGEVVGLRRALVRQLTHRFGPLPDALLASLQSITQPERLELLLDAATDAPDLDSFRSYDQLS